MTANSDLVCDGMLSVEFLKHLFSNAHQELHAKPWHGIL